MKPAIHKVGPVWVVEATSPRRKVRVQSWEEALRVAAGPTGEESRCQRCGRPMSSMPNRPIGVYHQRTLLHCHVCVFADPSLVEVGRRERVARMRARREAEEREREAREARKAARAEARAARVAAQETARQEREAAALARAEATRAEARRAAEEAEAEKQRAAEEARMERVIPAEALTRDPGLAHWLRNRNQRLRKQRTPKRPPVTTGGSFI